jgi:hypothetical protein
MSINTHIIDHEIKLMEMGGREEILLERETISLIILPESVATSLINPSLIPYVDDDSSSSSLRKSLLPEG